MMVTAVPTSPTNLTSLLFEHPFPDDADLIHTIDGSTTAGAVRQAALDCAHQLRSCGVTPGSAVMVRLPNEPRFVTTMFGVWAAAAVLVPANPRQPAFELDHVLTTTRPAAVIDEKGIEALDDPTRYEDEIAFVTWTSGTTGTPKAILQTHSGYLEL